MTLTPPQTFQSVAESDEFFALFPHRHDYIWAEHPRPGQKPSWQTESRHPLSDRLIQQGSYLYGVRFGAKTHYVLLDIDISSPYHPCRDRFAISRLVAALEPLGLVKAVFCTSSYNGGIHIYFPFTSAQNGYKLARVVQVLLENAGFGLSPGQLELFPNDRGFVDGHPALYAAHRLPMQAGSYLLNGDYEQIWSDRQTFVQQWRWAQQQNSLQPKTLEQVWKAAQRQKYRLSGKANKFLNDLMTEIYQGWTEFGQTNRLLGRIAMYCYIFWHSINGCNPLTGRSLVSHIVTIAQSLPGYTEFCRHQHEIEQRAEEWANSVESSHYFPYGIGKATHQEIADDPDPAPSWHQQKQAEARTRIQAAIAQMLEQDTLPSQTTARFNALVQAGIGGGTLYKHRDLWHPTYLTPTPITPEFETDNQFSTSDRQMTLPIGDIHSQRSQQSPPDPPKQVSGRTKDAPEYTNLLLQKSSKSLFEADLTSNQEQVQSMISSNTQDLTSPIDRFKQTLAAIQAVQAYKRAAQRETWVQLQLHLHPPQTPSAKRLAQMRQWLESGDPILMAEAEAFFASIAQRPPSD